MTDHMHDDAQPWQLPKSLPLEGFAPQPSPAATVETNDLAEVVIACCNGQMGRDAAIEVISELRLAGFKIVPAHSPCSAATDCVRFNPAPGAAAPHVPSPGRSFVAGAEPQPTPESVIAVLAKFHRNSCYPQASDGELRIYADEILALSRPKPSTDR